MVQQYRKKPIVIEAQQLTDDNAADVAIWCGGALAPSDSMVGRRPTVKIATLEGDMIAGVYDWIIRGVNGEFYPCKDDIFQKSYDLAATNPIDDVYEQRDKLVGLLSKVFPSKIGPVSDPEPGWSRAVYIELPTGQISFHVTDKELMTLFAHLSGDLEPVWDGHDNDEKWRRVELMTPTIHLSFDGSTLGVTE